MNNNESRMKQRGETKVWKSIETKTGSIKEVASTQIGQQIILEEALRILPSAREWIDKSSSTADRRELKNHFTDDEILLNKITQTFLLLAGSINNPSDEQKSKKVNRHKRINTLRSRVMPELSFEVTWRFLEVIVDLSEYFHVEKLLHHDKAGFSWNLKYSCMLSDTILDMNLINMK